MTGAPLCMWRLRLKESGHHSPKDAELLPGVPSVWFQSSAHSTHQARLPLGLNRPQSKGPQAFLLPRPWQRPPPFLSPKVCSILYPQLVLGASRHPGRLPCCFLCC